MSPRGQPTPQAKRLFESAAPSTQDSTNGLPEEIQQSIEDIRAVVVSDAFIARESSTEVARRIRNGELKDDNKWSIPNLMRIHQIAERSLSGLLGSLSAARGQGTGGDTNVLIVIEAPEGSNVKAIQENYPGVSISRGPKQKPADDQSPQMETDPLSSRSPGGEGAGDSDEGGDSIF